MAQMKQASIAIIGVGYWGPNLVRNFSKVKKVKQIHVCDLKQERLDYIKTVNSNLITTTKYDEILNNPEINAVIIATQPLATHYMLAKKAIEHGKNVFVEKPMTSSAKESRELIELAKKNNVILHVDHTFIYSKPIMMIKEMIDSGEIGEIYSIEMLRLNLGIFQNDFNVVWDLCPHDLSILDYLLGESPETVYASGGCHINLRVEDNAHVILRYKKNLTVHMHVSWLAPQKVRKITIVGSKKMVVFDDVEPVEKIKIYDKGISVETAKEFKQKYYESFAEYIYYYRHGDIKIPKIDFVEPLENEANHFIDCILESKKTKTDGNAGLKVVQIIEAANKSLKERKEISLGDD